jgi:superfamily II helicase
VDAAHDKLAALAERARYLDGVVARMCAMLDESVPITIQIEVNNLQEVLDLLRHKLLMLAPSPMDIL